MLIRFFLYVIIILRHFIRKMLSTGHRREWTRHGKGHFPITEHIHISPGYLALLMYLSTARFHTHWTLYSIFIPHVSSTGLLNPSYHSALSFQLSLYLGENYTDNSSPVGTSESQWERCSGARQIFEVVVLTNVIKLRQWIQIIPCDLRVVNLNCRVKLLVLMLTHQL
jgi:hypothetical protein